MNQWRKNLGVLSWLYKKVITTRNTLYDRDIFKSHEFDTPLIVVGNLRVGGTGKTPMVAYLVHLLKQQYRVAVLSRGYKRQTKGFILADDTVDAVRIGDEPYQLYRQHPDIYVAVDADRTNGIKQLQALNQPPEVIVLDDAFQHRKVKAGLNILLTPYNDLYTEDSLLPAGNLREGVEGAVRAQVIVVTKSPASLTEEQEFDIAKRLKVSLTQTVFFSTIVYADSVKNETDSIPVDKLKDYGIVLVTGIAQPQYLLDFLKSKEIKVKHLSYPDHHHFTASDIEAIKAEYLALKDIKKIILTTEKDYVRIFVRLANVFYLPIQAQFINHQRDFNQLISDYVEQSTRNR